MRLLWQLTLTIFGVCLLFTTLTFISSQNDHPMSYWIGFLSSRTKPLDQQLYRMRADGQIVEQLTHGPARRMTPSWSPDGAWISFTAVGETVVQVYKIPAQSNGTQPLPQIQQMTPNVTGGNAGASWSPDGKWLAYSSNRLGRNAEIFVLNLEDGAEYQLTDSRGSNRNPVWSPDGQWIAFVSQRHGATEIYRIRPDGRDEQRLTDSRGHNYYPTWSPDGEWIAFTSNRDGLYHLYKMRVNGSAVQRLTHEGTGNTVPAWSPDGQYIAYVSERDRNIEIYRMRANGSQQIRLTDSRGDNVYPTWSPPAPAPRVLAPVLVFFGISFIFLPFYHFKAGGLISIPRRVPHESMPVAFRLNRIRH
jgi:TolB protein